MPVLRVGPVLEQLDGVAIGRTVVVTDAGVASTGWPARVASALGADLWAGAAEEPSEGAVAEAARALGAYDTLVAVGGGSVIDTAKAASLLIANGGRVRDGRGYGHAAAAGPRLVAIPTTAGTGSEVQSFAVISHDDDRSKLAVGSAHLMPAVVILDAALTLSAPRRVTMLAGLDATVHALETAVSTARTVAGEHAAVEAFADLWTTLPRVLASPHDLDLRHTMLRAACQAGSTIEAGMLGAAHALANPLSARHGMAHGEAVARMIGPVVRVNHRSAEAAATYVRLAQAVGMADGEALAAALELRVAEWLPGGWPVIDADALAGEAMAQWTLGFNPVGLGWGEVVGVYGGWGS